MKSGEHHLGLMQDGSVRLKTTTCPRLLTGRPDIEDVFNAHSMLARFGDALPRAGGLEQQDAWLMQALACLRAEEDAVKALLQHEHMERRNKR